MRTSDSSGVLARWYDRRIGTPANADEVYGYWLFVAGLLLGVVGLLLFLSGARESTAREFGVAFAAAGLLLAVAGPVYRLPLGKAASYAVYLGGLLGVAAVAWFFALFPESWAQRPRFTGATGSAILLYAAGLAVIAAGAVLVPLASGEGDDGDDLAATAVSAARDADDARAAAEDERDDLAAALEEREAELAALHDSQSRFEVFEDAAGEFRWRLRHRNGNVVATSGEGYTRLHDAQKGLAAVRRDALGAALVRVEAPADATTAEPIEEPPVVAAPDDGAPGESVPEPEPPSLATFETYEDRAGEHRWRLVHDNGNIIADSGEGYTRPGEARAAVERVREYAGPAEYLRVDPAAFEVFRDAAGEWRWRLVHRNGNVLADSGQGYGRRRDAQRALAGVREDRDDVAVETYEDARGEHRWRLVHDNGNVLADSGEGYTEAGERDDAVDRFRRHAPDADELTVGRAAFEIYEDAGEEWRWRLRHRNGNVLADSGQGYGRRADAREAVDGVKRNAPGADGPD
jgi:uncharacterized protein YegP (UPF0339 family)